MIKQDELLKQQARNIKFIRSEGHYTAYFPFIFQIQNLNEIRDRQENFVIEADRDFFITGFSLWSVTDTGAVFDKGQALRHYKIEVYVNDFKIWEGFANQQTYYVKVPVKVTWADRFYVKIFSDVNVPVFAGSWDNVLIYGIYAFKEPSRFGYNSHFLNDDLLNVDKKELYSPQYYVKEGKWTHFFVNVPINDGIPIYLEIPDDCLLVSFRYDNFGFITSAGVFSIFPAFSQRLNITINNDLHLSNLPFMLTSLPTLYNYSPGIGVSPIVLPVPVYLQRKHTVKLDVATELHIPPNYVGGGPFSQIYRNSVMLNFLRYIEET